MPLLLLEAASLLHASPLAFDVITWLAGAYLLWLGVKLVWLARMGTALLSRRPQSLIDFERPARGAGQHLTNSKPLLFMLAFLPRFVSPNQVPRRWD